MSTKLPSMTSEARLAAARERVKTQCFIQTEKRKTNTKAAKKASLRASEQQKMQMQKSTPCPFFAAGKCKFGEACRHGHELLSPDSE